MRSRMASWIGPARCGRFAGSDKPLTGGLAGAYSGRQEHATRRLEVGHLELRFRGADVLAERVGALQQVGASVEFARFERYDSKDGGADGEYGGDLEVGVDAVAEPARSFHFVDPQRFGCRGDRVLVASV